MGYKKGLKQGTGIAGSATVGLFVIRACSIKVSSKHVAIWSREECKWQCSQPHVELLDSFWHLTVFPQVVKLGSFSIGGCGQGCRVVFGLTQRISLDDTLS